MPVECPWASMLPILCVWHTDLCPQIIPLHSLHCLWEGQEGSGLKMQVATLFLHDFLHPLYKGQFSDQKAHGLWNLLISWRANTPSLNYLFLFFSVGALLSLGFSSSSSFSFSHLSFSLVSLKFVPFYRSVIYLFPS